MAGIEDLLGTPSNYATPDQIKRAQEYAYDLMQPEHKEQYRHWSQGARDILGALAGRQMLHSTNEQQRGLMGQAAQATAQATPVPTEQQKLNTQPQTSIEGYNGPVPPMHQLPSKEAIAAHALQLTPEARERYLESVQKMSTPITMEVDNGTLVGNPVNQKWTFQPKTREIKQGADTLMQTGQKPIGVPVPGYNPYGGATHKDAPVIVNSPDEVKSKGLKSGTSIIFHGPNGWEIGKVP